MRWVLLAILVLTGCSPRWPGAAGAPSERELLRKYPGARVLTRAELADGFALIFTFQGDGKRQVGLALARQRQDDVHETDAWAQAVERMQGLDTPLAVRTTGKAGDLLVVAGLASGPGAARVEVSVNRGTPVEATVRNGGYLLVTGGAELQAIDIRLFDKSGNLLDRWPLTGVPSAQVPRRGL
jgi:hypothetical protein